jgi:hypothetical protein
MLMVHHGSNLAYGAATLFSTPGLKGGGTQMPGYVSLVFVAVVMMLPLVFYRRGGSKPGPSNSEGDDGWGKGPEPPPVPNGPPTGGIPLDDAVQSRMRLRGKARLSDVRPARVRRPAREPEHAPAREITFQ